MTANGTEGPYAHINRVHRELVDGPWGPPQPTRHRLRAQWRERQAPRHLVAGALPGERLGRRLRRALLLLSLAAAAAAFWLAWPWLPRW